MNPLLRVLIVALATILFLPGACTLLFGGYFLFNGAFAEGPTVPVLMILGGAVLIAGGIALFRWR